MTTQYDSYEQFGTSSFFFFNRGIRKFSEMSPSLIELGRSDALNRKSNLDLVSLHSGLVPRGCVGRILHAHPWVVLPLGAKKHLGLQLCGEKRVLVLAGKPPVSQTSSVAHGHARRPHGLAA